VRRAAKVLKTKDPEQLFSWLLSTGGKVCAETASEREKLSSQAKTDQLNGNAPRNHPATPNLNKLHFTSAKL
jgi:hypothetical protein